MTVKEFKEIRKEYRKDWDLIYPDISIANMNKPVELYGPNNKFLGVTSSAEVFYDWCLRIKLKQAKGYSIKFSGETINVDKNGILEKHPEGLLDIYTLIMLNLLQNEI